MRDRAIVLLIVCILVGVVGLPKKGSALPFGADLIEQNGHAWLSPVWSQNVSYLDMINRLSNRSSDYYGLRVATVREVVDMFNSIPLVHPNIPKPFSIGIEVDGNRVLGPAEGVMDPFFNKFGWSEERVYPEYSRVLHGYNWDPARERLMSVGMSESDIYGGAFSSENYEIFCWANEVSNKSAMPNYGTWLVEASPVPEPSTVILFGVGLAGLVWQGRKQKKY